MNYSVCNNDSQDPRDTAELKTIGIDSDDIMMCSLPRIERLQLFDYPRTPASIARSSGMHLSATSQSKLRTSKHPIKLNSWSRYNWFYLLLYM